MESAMEMPSVQTKAYDRKLNITYIVNAHRPLTEHEMIVAIRMLWGQRKSKRPKPNTTMTILSLIGLHEPM
jgi:hypothetical protein